MKLYGLTDLSLGFFNGSTSCDATGKVRHIGGEIIPCIFNDDGVSHNGLLLEAGLFRMLFRVPGARSSL